MLEGSDSGEAHPPQHATKSIKTTKNIKSANRAPEKSSERAEGAARKGGSTKTSTHTDNGAAEAKSSKSKTTKNIKAASKNIKATSTASGHHGTKRDESEYSRHSTPAKAKQRKQ